MERLILHCDLNNFYASVECKLHPELRDKPVAVAGNPEKRHGVILAKNEIAKAKGVRTGDVIWQAKQKEPNLILLPPHFSEYMKITKQVFKIYNDYTPLVEPFGSDECWLDCTGTEKLFGDGKTLGDTIRERVFRETGLTASVGVSFNKIFAKMGSDLKKPYATTVISRQNFKDKLWNLKADEMMMIGRKTYAKLRKMNIVTLGDLAHSNPTVLKNRFGINGIKIWEYANGLDAEEVREAVKGRAVESVGHGMTALKDITDIEDLTDMFYYLADLVGTRLRRYGLKGSVVHISLRFTTLEHISRQEKLPYYVCTGSDIALNAARLAEELWDKKSALRTVSVYVSDFVSVNKGDQISMFDDKERRKRERLDNALDYVRQKYGYNCVRRANLIGRNFIYDKDNDEDFLPFQR